MKPTPMSPEASQRLVAFERRDRIADLVRDRGSVRASELTDLTSKRAMIEAGSEVILLVDASKFGHNSLVRVAALDAVSTVVTSASSDAGTIGAMRDMGIEVIVAEPIADARPATPDDVVAA
jgi:DeoR/GlpR family transcriptional regulator of sugar metabolism